MKIKDLSPKLSLKSAEQELSIPLGTVQMGERVGGLSTFANSFKRGYGNNVFGSDDNGIYLGAADFEDAPWSVSMAGLMFFQSEGGNVVIDAQNNRILIYDASGVPRILIGYHQNGF